MKKTLPERPWFMALQTVLCIIGAFACGVESQDMRHSFGERALLTVVGLNATVLGVLWLDRLMGHVERKR